MLLVHAPMYHTMAPCTPSNQWVAADFASADHFERLFSVSAVKGWGQTWSHGLLSWLVFASIAHDRLYCCDVSGQLMVLCVSRDLTGIDEAGFCHT